MSETMQTGWEPLPIDQWEADMIAAVENIHRIGCEMLAKHREAGEHAAEISEQWKLDERQTEEHDALLQLQVAIRKVTVALSAVLENASPAHMNIAVDAINRHLPEVEETFVTIRHAALDLLRWTRRSGYLDDSTLPEQYRASYAALISYTPQFRQRIITLRDQLWDWSEDEAVDPAVQKLLAALTRYNGVMDAARGFVRAIVEPSFDLVFQETQGWVEEWQHLESAVQAALGTELNDRCQFLLYDRSKFSSGVEEVDHQVAEGIDASLFAIECKGHKVLFSVDEDPLFQQLTVTLYRSIPSDRFEKTCEELFDLLYHELR